MGKSGNNGQKKRAKGGLSSELEQEVFDSIDLGIMETVREGLSIVQVNMGKRHDVDHLDSYFSERTLKADVLLVQEPPLRWDDKGVLGIRGFTAYHWMKEKKPEKDKVVSEFVKVKSKRGKRGGKRSLEVRKSNLVLGGKKKDGGKKKLKAVGIQKKVVVKKNEGSEGKVNGLGGGDHVRTCVYVRSNLIACLRAEALSRDQVAVEICHNSSDKSLVVSSLYVENGKFPMKMLKRVANTPWMKSQRVIMGADANSRHLVCNP